MAIFEINLSKLIDDHLKNDEKTQGKYIEHLCAPFANNDKRFQKQRGLHAILLSAFLLINNTNTSTFSRNVAKSIDTDIELIDCMSVLLDLVESASESMHELIHQATITENVILEFEC